MCPSRPGQPSLDTRHRIILDGMRRLSPAGDRLIVNAATVPTARSASRSPRTIKTQAKSIYRKPGAASRGQAVARARELGLLEG